MLDRSDKRVNSSPYSYSLAYRSYRKDLKLKRKANLKTMYCTYVRHYGNIIIIIFCLAEFTARLSCCCLLVKTVRFLHSGLIVNMCTESRKSGKDLHLFYSPKKYQGNIDCSCSVAFMAGAAVRAIDVRVTSRYLHQVALSIGTFQLQSITELYGFKRVFTLPSPVPVDVTLRSSNATYINKLWLIITGKRFN